MIRKYNAITLVLFKVKEKKLWYDKNVKNYN